MARAAASLANWATMSDTLRWVGLTLPLVQKPLTRSKSSTNGFYIGHKRHSFFLT